MPAGRPTYGRRPPGGPVTERPSEPTTGTSGSAVLDASLPFARRHIGPAPEDQAKMLAVLGYSSLEDLVDAAVPASVHSATPLALPAGRAEHEVLDELRELAGRNQVLTSMIGLGYHGTVTPAGDPAQRAGEPGLVHRLHALPAGDLAGPAGGAAELPDRGHRPHRPPGGRRQPARRGHRGGRGDDARPPHQQGARRRGLRRRRRGAAADLGRDPDPGRAARPRRSSSPTCTPTGCRTATCSACCCSTPGRPGRCATSPTSPPRRRSAVPWSLSPPTCWR